MLCTSSRAIRGVLAPLALIVGLTGCAHSSGDLAQLASRSVGCHESDVGIFEVRDAGDGRTDYLAYCRGQSYDCHAIGRSAECTRHGRALVQDAERARVAPPDREVHRTGEGNATLLTVAIDAGRSRLTIYAYPRAAGDQVTVVVDSRLREATRAECPFALLADADALGLERTAHEDTSYGERTTLRGAMIGIRRASAASSPALRVCTEMLPIGPEDVAALATFVRRWDEERAAAGLPTP